MTLVCNAGPVIALAKIEQVGPHLEQARSMGYWLSDELIEIARNLAGE